MLTHKIDTVIAITIFLKKRDRKKKGTYI